ncbi:hypothetical protein JQN63_24495 [Delftia lacustris]|uniref:hypothetical protein n=1 Tax=Delftia lacustris TaxID=558537 RepID=UPI00193C81BD|nr:hypothetical protein [Delftia lacustris]QRI89360.1 hypothetical protein JQN63_24495 [Delftia lacustris]
MNAFFRKQAGRFRRLTATQVLTLLRNQHPRQAALLRLLPCLSMLAVCAVLLDSLLPIPLWAIASLTVVMAAYIAHNCQSFVATQRRKSTLRHLARSCLLHAG